MGKNFVFPQKCDGVVPHSMKSSRDTLKHFGPFPRKNTRKPHFRLLKAPLYAYSGQQIPSSSPGLDTLTSLDGDISFIHTQSACGHCQYPCHLTGIQTCESSDVLQSWAEESHQKPLGFDTSHAFNCDTTGIQIATVSLGGRMNKQWKSENQDTFFYGSLPSETPPLPTRSFNDNDNDAAPSSHPQPHHTPFMMGVIDGHGKFGHIVADKVKEAFMDIIHSQHNGISKMYTTTDYTNSYDDGDDTYTTQIPHSEASVSHHEEWLTSCFAKAADKIDSLDIDISKSGAAAVVCTVHASRITAAWTGDSRAILGMHIATPVESIDLTPIDEEDGEESTQAIDNNTNTKKKEEEIVEQEQAIHPHTKCTRVIIPLTRDHKPDPLSCPAEAERIIASGGRIDRLATDRYGNPIGPFRIFLPDKWSPGLALSRAFGDTLAQSIGVTSIPEVNSIMLPRRLHFDLKNKNSKAHATNSTSTNNSTSTTSTDMNTGSTATDDDEGMDSVQQHTGAMNAYHVLIIASDGLWEWVSTEHAMSLAWNLPNAHSVADALAELARKHWATVYRGDVCDDITIAVAFIPI